MKTLKSNTITLPHPHFGFQLGPKHTAFGVFIATPVLVDIVRVDFQVAVLEGDTHPAFLLAALRALPMRILTTGKVELELLDPSDPKSARVLPAESAIDLAGLVPGSIGHDSYRIKATFRLYRRRSLRAELYALGVPLCTLEMVQPWLWLPGESLE